MLKKGLLIVIIVTGLVALVGCSGNTNTNNSQDDGVKESVQQEEIIITDDDIVKISYIDKRIDGFGRYGVRFVIENKTDDTIQITTKNTSVDELMKEHSLFIDITQGKKAEYEVFFDGIEDAEGLINIEGSIVVRSQDMSVDYGNYEFNIE
ncbi:MAG: hypothetical protein RSC26_13545 [Terrisporobacter sp.]